MCETYIVEYTCGCTDVKFLYTCKPHCVGSSMIRHKDARLRAQACDMHGGPYDSPNVFWKVSVVLQDPVSPTPIIWSSFEALFTILGLLGMLRLVGFVIVRRMSGGRLQKD